MSLLVTIPPPLYKKLTENCNWTCKAAELLNLRDSYKNDGIQLINYLDRKGYTLRKFQQLLQDCESLETPIKPSNPILKIALLVANAKYDNWSNLVTPVTDCRVVGNLLKDMGFTIIFIENVTSHQFKKTIVELCSVFSPKSYVLFYFAGHGFELCGTKYMLGIESPSENYTIDNGVSENFILKYGFKNEPDLFILLLDMCRKQPDQKLNPNIYLNIPPMEEYKHTCNLIIGYATSPYMPSFEELFGDSTKSTSQIQHDTCEINSAQPLPVDCCMQADNSKVINLCGNRNSNLEMSESDGIGDQLTRKLNDQNRSKGVSLYVHHLSKHLKRKEDFVKILEMVHKDFANEQCKQTASQKPQKLDNVTKQFYLNVKAIGNKETEDKLENVVKKLSNDVVIRLEIGY